MKYCPACDKDKKESEFGGCKSRPGGRAAYCLVCTRLKAKEKRSRPDYPAKQRFFFMQWKYGITQEDFASILEAQDEKCAVCRTPETDVIRPGVTRSGKKNRGLVVDHDHTTKVVRGLLCDRCNRAIGLLREDVEVLRRAAEYVLSGGINFAPKRAFQSPDLEDSRDRSLLPVDPVPLMGLTKKTSGT